MKQLAKKVLHRLSMLGFDILMVFENVLELMFKILWWIKCHSIKGMSTMVRWIDPGETNLEYWRKRLDDIVTSDAKDVFTLLDLRDEFKK